MSTLVDKLILTAINTRDRFFWPRYVPGAQSSEADAQIMPGGLVVPAAEVAGLQTVQGYMVSNERLGTGVVAEIDAAGMVLVAWSGSPVETWAAPDDLRPIEAGRTLITILNCDGRGHRTLLGHRVVPLEHHWTVELRPQNIVRAERKDGLSWAFVHDPATHGVMASWIAPPEDDDAEALTAAELATMHR